MDVTVNGRTLTVPADYEDDLLLWLLRDGLGLTGTKYGCGAGICGSCTVHVDGAATRACVTPVRNVAGKRIRTIEDLADGETLHPVQQAFLDGQVPQCAWCMSGQMMQAAAFLEEVADPTPAEIEVAMANNYCRCGCYARIRIAVAEAAVAIQERAA